MNKEITKALEAIKKESDNEYKYNPEQRILLNRLYHDVESAVFWMFEEDPQPSADEAVTLFGVIYMSVEKILEAVSIQNYTAATGGLEFVELIMSKFGVET